MNEVLWRPVRFQQSMKCPHCEETFDIVVTAMMRGNDTTWTADLAAQQIHESDIKVDEELEPLPPPPESSRVF